MLQSCWGTEVQCVVEHLLAGIFAGPVEDKTQAANLYLPEQQLHSKSDRPNGEECVTWPYLANGAEAVKQASAPWIKGSRDKDFGPVKFIPVHSTPLHDVSDLLGPLLKDQL